MAYEIAVVFKHEMNFGNVSHSISFCNTIEDISKIPINMDNGIPQSRTLLYAFPAEVAEKMLEWRNSVSKLLPENVDIIETTYKPIMRRYYVKAPFPMVDGIETELRLGSFSDHQVSAFTHVKLKVGFFKMVKFGNSVIKQDYLYQVVEYGGE